MASLTQGGSVKAVDFSQLKRHKLYLIYVSNGTNRSISIIKHRGFISRNTIPFSYTRYRYSFLISRELHTVPTTNILKLHTADSLYKEDCIFETENESEYEFFEIDFSEFAYHVVSELI